MTDDHRCWNAEIPEGARHRPDERWLVIEFDPESSGWFLFVCTTPTSAKRDYWFQTREKAFGQAAFGWAVRDAEFRLIDEGSGPTRITPSM